MTDLLKQLLHSYGLLFITITQLQKERRGTSHASLDEYYKSLGPAEAGEPVLAVRISKDGEVRFLREVDAASMPLPKDYRQGSVTVWELPEDEFYFFRAFRLGLFDLEKSLPSFLLQMALIYGYTIFEAYIADVIRVRLSAHPAQLGKDKQISFGDILESESKQTLIAKIIDRELQRIMHEPISAILDRLRSALGFRSLTSNHDREIIRLSFIRNCLLHNGGNADHKLVEVEPSLSIGQPIDVEITSLSSAINVFRKLAFAIDIGLEELGGKAI
jgi:hypothetical protein